MNKNKKLKVRARFAFKSDRLDVALLNDVKINGEDWRDHIWVEYRPKMAQFQSGDIIEFEATYHTYIGLDKEGNYVQKKAFKKIREIKKSVALTDLKQKSI